MALISGATVLRLVAALGSIIVFLVVAEGVVRLVGLDPFFQNRIFVLNRALDYPEIFKKDHDLFWRLKPDQTVTSRFFIGRTYHINSMGLHGPDVDLDHTGPRIVTMGNSCTFGWGVPTGAGYPRQLEAMLPDSFQVINAGVPGYTSLQGKRFYTKDLSGLDPDYVTILFGFNDHWAAASEISDKEQEPPPQWILDIQNTMGELHTYRLMKKALLSAIEPDIDSLYSRTEPVYRVGLDDFYRNLVDLAGMVQADDAEPILLTSPIASLKTYYPPGHKSNLHTYHEFYNAVVRQVAREQNCRLVDLAEELDQYEGLFDDPMVDPIHFNEKGHQIAAAALRTVFLSKPANATD